MTSSSSSIKEERMLLGETSLEDQYNHLCFDLNMDNETKMDAWRCYEHIRRHYVLEGDPIHWLAVSLYLSCRRNHSICSNENNPISISRLLQTANHLSLICFFDKLHKWEDMANLPDQLRNKINQIENSFQISSIIFEKYSQIFEEIFGENLHQSFSFDYQQQRKLIQINPKLNPKSKEKKCSLHHLYSLIWTIYALAKTIYPATFNDLIASFHLLLASFEFIYQLTKKHKLHHLLKGECVLKNEESIIDHLSSKYCCSSEMTRTIYEEYFRSDLFEKIEDVEEGNVSDVITMINKKYDEIVLTHCIIDERIFLENQNQFNDLLNSLNENRNSRLDQNKTPLTANQHFIHSNAQPLNLTPISQANQLIQLLHSIVNNQSTKPSANLIQLIGQEHFLDDLHERLNEWERMFLTSYHSNDLFDRRTLNESDSCRSRFQLALRLFYNALENLLAIEKKRSLSNHLSHQEIQQSFHKLMLNNEFLKSLLGLCLLLVLYSHSDLSHDFCWILNLYSLQGYSFLKIIQIYFKTSKEICKCRSLIKYLSSIEEIILSSLAFENNSALWNDIQSKGILTYQQIEQLQRKTTHSNTTTPTNLSHLYSQSPIQQNHVKRKLFQNTTTEHNPPSLSIIRSQSDPVVDRTLVKMSPYTMFYRQFYQLVLRRLNLLTLRLFGSKSNEFEKILWNFFSYLFTSHTQILFQQRDLDQILLSSIYYLAHSSLFPDHQQLTWTRLIQAYKAIPNSKLKTLRSVFIRKINAETTLNQHSYPKENPCLTPSKPAGSVQIFDGNLYGDITSFYDEVFLRIDDFQDFFSRQIFFDLPPRSQTNDNPHDQVSIHCGKHFFIHYSSNVLQSNSTNSPSEQFVNHSSKSADQHSTNILSSSIQAGANNTVRTTRIRTEDGKFLTTISTIQKLNDGNENEEKTCVENHRRNVFFGQSSMNSLKRTFSDSNSLTSLSKKVLQIENDRQGMQQ